MANNQESTLDWNFLVSVLRYDYSSGVFFWLKDSSRRKSGDMAGYIRQDGYSEIKLNFEKFFGHRLAWFYVFKKWPEFQIDHINGDRSNNRISNLRESNQHENLKNRAISSNNTSGVMGVSLDKSRGLYIAVIGVNGKIKNLGRFKTMGEAISARKASEQKYGYHPNHGRRVA